LPLPRRFRRNRHRHLPADDARVAALLERLAPELAADAARNDVDGRFPRTSRGCIAPG
jgi:hypothetical protein